MLAEEAPKITDWMQAWGSLAGLVMSTAAVIFTGLLFRHEIRVRREEQRDNEAAQARLVFVQLAGWERQGGDGPIVKFRWRIKNYSAMPILNATVIIAHDDHGLKWFGPLDVFEVVDDEASGETIVPPTTFLDEDIVRKETEVNLQFTDAAGRLWTRSGNKPPVRYRTLTRRRMSRAEKLRQRFTKSLSPRRY